MVKDIGRGTVEILGSYKDMAMYTRWGSGYNRRVIYNCPYIWEALLRGAVYIRIAMYSPKYAYSKCSSGVYIGACTRGPGSGAAVVSLQIGSRRGVVVPSGFRGPISIRGSVTSRSKKRRLAAKRPERVPHSLSQPPGPQPDN